jgi:hypothetical protein
MFSSPVVNPVSLPLHVHGILFQSWLPLRRSVARFLPLLPFSASWCPYLLVLSPYYESPFYYVSTLIPLRRFWRSFSDISLFDVLVTRCQPCLPSFARPRHPFSVLTPSSTFRRPFSTLTPFFCTSALLGVRTFWCFLLTTKARSIMLVPSYH